MGRAYRRTVGHDRDATFDPLAEANRQFLAHDLDRPRSMHAAVSLIHAHQVVSTRIERTLRPLGLTFARYEVLMLLSFSRSGSLPITKVGERLLVHPTGATKLVDKLEAQDLVCRKPNPQDRRGTLAEITPAGRRLGQRASSLLGEIGFGVDLPDPDLETLIELLRTVRSMEA
ncbi:MAG: MarR family transcriptional regulator [Acidimicrobiales bacterium]|nr:MarR family transcriptional regulator [Acidimicrobiales bacterium]